jgi:hypothetical protein
MEKEKERLEESPTEEQAAPNQEPENDASSDVSSNDTAPEEKEEKEQHEEQEAEAAEAPVEVEQEEPEEHHEGHDSKDAKALIEEARQMVEESDKEIKSCMEVLDEDIEAFEETKSKLLKGVVEETEELIEETGFEPQEIEDVPEEGLNFESDDAVKPMYVQNLSSGKFGAFILSLIAAIAAIGGWFYVGAQQLGMPLDTSRMLNGNEIHRILTWIGGGMTGGTGDSLIGLGIVALSTLVVMWIVYKLKVYLRAQSNLHKAQKVKEEAKFYCTKKEECKAEMEKVSTHIHKVIEALHFYRIFFEEQNAKIKRILYLEGKHPFEDYHLKSKEEIKHTNMLLESLNELLSTPMADGSGSVSEAAKAQLQRAERTLARFKEHLYN